MHRQLDLTQTLTIALLSIFVAFAMTGCGADNVAACEDWLDTVSCGTTDFSTLVDCNMYEDYDCDVADYFDCLSDHTTCDETLGIADTSGWASCASLAVCD